ncbi:CamS family sex pheromone protein [Evansella cellulosilytica]|uniref:CamS sex pheromone cAM373 family protein n=1 Tax=Evansella cellulosilytica (strain ATCC 21833 / DSM 2522 / FERM P-1141 / JCM 9156 / N-4) TaxID=649639 RepID=E6TWN2_EVAC2|nr:CamS family sex pheromone protein [Evansella cellulosilytica]ADU28715.1 CamS sex pheromone cAM373 family protein [Evansella cellulosilytica DSM 2522]
MKRKLSIVCISFLLLLTGCIPTLDRGEEEIIVVEQTEETEEQHFVITPTIDTPENYYRNLLPDGIYHRSEARGTVAHTMNNRIDMNQFELGLMEIATARYSQEDFYFQEGELLTGNTINSWLRRYNPNEDRYRFGLNPPLGEGDDLEEQMRKSPIVLSHVMEHNYVQRNDDGEIMLGGIVIGLSLNSVYYFRTEDEEGRYYFHEEPIEPEDAEAAGKEMAEQVVERIRARDGLENVPITIALYQEERRGAIVPGTFISMAHISGEDAFINDWEEINEQFFFFPSSNARTVHPNLSNSFGQFKDEVEEFFGRSMGIVGKGRYKNDALDELTIEFNLQSHGKAEIIALTQFVSGKVSSLFTFDAPINVYINSVNGPEAIIIQYPGEDPYIHVYK